MNDQMAAITEDNRGNFQIWTGLAAFLLILVEVSWLIPWYMGVIEISYVTSGLRTFLVLGGNMLQAYLVTRLAETLHLKRSIQQILLGGLFIANMALATHLLLDPTTPNHLERLINLDPGPVLVVLTGVWLWGRGSSLAQGIINPMTAWRRFWLGIWMLVAYLLVVVRVTRLQPNLIPFVVFLGTGLMALIVSRVAYIGQYYRAQRSPFRRDWLAAISTTVGASILLAALFASLLTGPFKLVFSQLSEVLRWVVAGVIFLLSIPGLILAYILAPLLQAFQAMLQRASVPAPTAAPNMLVTPIAPPNVQQLPELVMIPPWIINLLFWAVMLGITVAIFSRGRTFHKWGLTQNLDDPESLLRQDELWRRLRQAARQQFVEAGNRIRKFGTSRSRQAAYIRRIYAEFMDLMIVLEKPRPAGVTPLEYLPITQQFLPSVYSDLEKITRAYIRVRYGELPESDSEISQLEQAWQRIYAEGERQKTMVQANHKRLADEQLSQ